jgi:hypothetical protein
MKAPWSSVEKSDTEIVVLRDNVEAYTIIRSPTNRMWELRQVDSDVVLEKDQYRYDILGGIESGRFPGTKLEKKGHKPFKKLVGDRELSVFKNEDGDWTYVIRIATDKPDTEWECWDLAACGSYEECVEQAKAQMEQASLKDEPIKPKHSIAFKAGKDAKESGIKLEESALKNLLPGCKQYCDFIAGYDSLDNTKKR